MTDTRKIALVTGGAKRIGKQIAIALAKNGWDIVIHYNNSENSALETAEIIKNMGRKAEIIKADLSSYDETISLVYRAEKIIGKISCLINNASVFIKDDNETASEENWNLNFDVNAKAPFFLSLEFAKNIKKNNHGIIINILDQRVGNPGNCFLTYTASKCLLKTLTKTLALSLAPQIRVNAIAPGITLPSLCQNEESFKKMFKETPLKQSSEPEEIAEAVVFITKTQSLTGETIFLDGGKRLTGNYFV